VMNKIKLFATFFSPALVFLPTIVRASAASDISDGISVGFDVGTDPLAIVMIVINSFIVILGILAVVALIYGGIQYITSAGDTSAADKGKNTIVAAVIGIALLVSSFFIIKLIANTTDSIAYENVIAPETAKAVTLRDLTGRNPEGYTDVSDATDYIKTEVFPYIIWVCVIAAFCSILYASYLYFTSYGDSGKMDQAKKIFVLTVVGFVILALGARLVNTLILDQNLSI